MSSGGNWISIYDLPMMDQQTEPSGITVYGIKWKRGRSYDNIVYDSYDATYSQYQISRSLLLALCSQTDNTTYQDVFDVQGYGPGPKCFFVTPYWPYRFGNYGKYATMELSTIEVTPEVDGDYWVLLYDNIPATYNGYPKSPIINACVGSSDRYSTSDIANTFRTAGVDVQVLVE